MIRIKSLRTAKRFLIWDTRAMDTDCLPPNAIAFQTTGRSIKNPHVSEKLLHLDFKPKSSDRILAHPTFVFGYNPHINVNIGVINFHRIYCATTNHDGILKL